MGCGSSREVQVERNGNLANGNVKRESPPPRPQPQPVVRAPTPGHKPDTKSRESSAHSRKSKRSRKSSTSSSSSDSSHGSRESVKETKKVVEPTPAAAPVITSEQPVTTETKPQTEEQPKQVTNEQPEVKQAEEAKPDLNANQEITNEELAVTEVSPQTEVIQPTETAGLATTEPEPCAEAEGQDKPNFSEDILKSFVQLETEIKGLEVKDHGNTHMAKYQQLLELHKTLTAKGQQVEELKKQTVKEYQDVVQMNHPSVRAMFANQAQLDAQVSKEYQEYLDALNKQEVAEQELNSSKEQYKNLYNIYNSETETVKKDMELLNEKRLEQEALLGKAFNDCYGSDQEWKLEMELDLLSEKKERVRAAHYKWTNAKRFLHSAVNQILWSVRRWGQIGQLKIQAPMVKYQMSAETRNHLVAAIQNIKGTHGFLDPIKVPYCTTEDIQELESAINTIFHDVQITDRYSKAYSVYHGQYNKALNLLTWIDNVLENTINKDFTEVKKLYHNKYFELKEERMNLIQAMIKEKLGIEMMLELNKEEFVDEKEVVQEQADVVKPGAVEKEEGEDQAPEPEEESDKPPAAAPVATSPEEGAPEATEGAEEGAAENPEVKPVPLAELAPPPNVEDLFGDIEQLKKKHEEEMAEFEKAQEMNKTRVEQGLQEKLRARRSRRRKVESQKAEEAILAPPE